MDLLTIPTSLPKAVAPRLFGEFLRGYLNCLFWTEMDDNGNPLCDKYAMDDLSAEAVDTSRSDCVKFVSENTIDLLAAVQIRGYSWERAGNDFLLTRNKHGAGFWDRGYEDFWGRLSSSSSSYANVGAYVGDDGKVHV